MQFTQSVAVIFLFGAALVAASPAPVPAPVIDSADSDAEVTIYSGDTCNGSSSGFSLDGSGSQRCVPVTNARSIRVGGGGCTTTTWSGSNCAGSSFVVPDANCHSVLYASVSVVCH